MSLGRKDTPSWLAVLRSAWIWTAGARYGGGEFKELVDSLRQGRPSKKVNKREFQTAYRSVQTASASLTERQQASVVCASVLVAILF